MSTPQARLKEARKRYEALAADSAKIEQVHAERLEAFRKARAAGADFGDMERHQAALSNVTAMRETHREDLEAIAADIADAEAAVAQDEADKAREHARRKLEQAEADLRDQGDRFRELIEEPQRKMAEAIARAVEAHASATDHGIEAKQPRLTRYVTDDTVSNWQRPWLRHTLENIARLATQLLRERRKATVDPAEIEAKQQARARDARKRMLRKLRDRNASGDHERREVLEADVGAELDAELASEAAA